MKRLILAALFATLCGFQLNAGELPVISSDDLATLDEKVGQVIVVEGVIKRVGKGPNDGIVFLNFGENRNGFVAVIFRSFFHKFPDGFEHLAQQKVKVTGELEKFKETQPQIRVSDPSQIEVVQ